MPTQSLLCWKLWMGAAILALLAGCSPGISPGQIPAVTEHLQPVELVYYSWQEDATSVVFDQFTQETGIKVRHESYISVEEAVEAIRTDRGIDVVSLESASVPQLIQDGSLAELDFSNVPNFKYVSPSFRDLTYDPGNKYSIPNGWGTTGLVVRTDLVDQPVTRWGDLWAPELAGRVVLWNTMPRDVLGMALHSLGYSANSADPVELDAALAHLVELAPSAIWLDDEETSAPWLIDGTAAVALGWAYDYWTAQEANVPIDYVLPDDGALLWNDNFVIPANSANKEAAERLIDFFLRPEVAGQIIDANYYPIAHDTARSFTDASIRDDPVIFPETSDLQGAELQMPLTADGQRLWESAWKTLLANIP